MQYCEQLLFNGAGKEADSRSSYSPKKQKYMPKGCVMLRRELFPAGIIESITNGR